MELSMSGIDINFVAFFTYNPIFVIVFIVIKKKK